MLLPEIHVSHTENSSQSAVQIHEFHHLSSANNFMEYTLKVGKTFFGIYALQMQKELFEKV